MQLMSAVLNELNSHTSDALTRITHGLAHKGFTLLLPETGVHDFTGGLVKFDQQQVKLAQILFRFGMGLYGSHDMAAKAVKQLIGFEPSAPEQEAIEVIVKLMFEWFSINAIKFTTTSGVAYVVVIDADHLDDAQIVEKVNQFVALNMLMLQINGKFNFTFAGKRLFTTQYPVVSGSICVLCSDMARKAGLRVLLDGIRLHDDSWMNLMKRILTDWRTWAFGIFGFVRVPKAQLRQQKIVYDATTKVAESSVPGATAWQFGFAMSDIV